MRATAVEYIATTVTALVLRYAVAIREAEHLNHQRSLRIVLRECSRSVLWMGLIGVQIGCLITIGTTGHRLNLLELWQLCQLLQNLHQVWIMPRRAACQQLAKVLYGRWNALNKMLFLLKIAAESVSTQHLQGTEQHKQRQTIYKVAHRGHLDVILQRVVVLVHQFTAQLVWILSRGLPQERSHIVVKRTFSAALVINKPRIAIVV